VLAATARLRRREEFAATVRGGRRASRGALVVHVTTPTESATGPARTGGTLPARAGFVVSKAVGPAVVRNLVRRRLRHATRDNLAALPPGTALVIRALPAAATRTYPDLADDLREALAAAIRPRPRDRTAR
jgi:ribonuclease P protein component